MRLPPTQAPGVASNGASNDGSFDLAGLTQVNFLAIIEEQAEMVSLATPLGVLVYVNPAYARHFNREPQAMIGTSLFDYVADQDRTPVRELLDDVLRCGITRHSENRMLGADGGQRWVTWTNSVQRSPGHGALLQSVGRDITERRLAEIALRASQAAEERSRRVAGIGGWEVDLRSGVVTWSDQTRRIHEVADDYQPTLETAIAFYAPEARATIEAAVRGGIAEGRPWDLELPLITASGRHRWVRAVGEVEFDQGVAVRLVGAFQDITERRQLERQVMQNERFLRQITDSLPIRVAYLDRDRRYRFVNPEMLRLFDRPIGEVIGRSRSELLPGIADNVLAQRAEAVLAGQAQQFEFEDMVAGVPRRFENRLIPDCTPAGDVRGFVVTGIDITDRSRAEKAVKELAAIFDNTPDYVVQTDPAGQVLYLNASARRALGLTQQAPVGHLHVADIHTPATQHLYTSTVLPALERAGVWLGETTVLLHDQREVPVSHMVIAHRDVAGRIERHSAVMRDISAAVRAHQAIVRQTAILKSVADAMPAEVAVTDREGCYRFVNRAFEQWCGMPAERLLGCCSDEVLGEAEYRRRRPSIERAMAGETVTLELTAASADAERHLVVSYIPLRDEHGEVEGLVAITQDISEHKQEASRLMDLALRDPLTGLLNRAGFEQALDLLAGASTDRGVALLYVDLDRFKPVNDLHGHPVGDEVLKQFATRLKALVRLSDVVARLGGDEFALALSSMRELADAQAIAEKLVAAAREPFEIQILRLSLRLSLSASVGVAFSADAVPNWPSLIARADEALLQAKALGRGRQVGTDS